ncbi:unnamed protein product [Cyprideis torosa]|uniref:Neurotransmitter-gated ion-channel transmembrane domain-containing protein n=1 Tax=Cyprideis torosa TaxID=163714 RepID=A0A7R8X050_9CRUS|nr:unnamed protein product [Cyprideis torosa]CAG0910374.1 unnamed protein product [Cyprideis torosa]
MEHSSSRMLLCIGGVLGVTVFYGAVQQSLPGVSYVRSIDAWLLTCLILTMVPFLVFVLQSIWGTTMGYTVQSESGSVAAEPSPRRHNIIVAGR